MNTIIHGFRDILTITEPQLKYYEYINAIILPGRNIYELKIN
jgi:hypothetical protein